MIPKYIMILCSRFLFCKLKKKLALQNVEYSPKIILIEQHCGLFKVLFLPLTYFNKLLLSSSLKSLRLTPLHLLRGG